MRFCSSWKWHFQWPKQRSVTTLPPLYPGQLSNCSCDVKPKVLSRNQENKITSTLNLTQKWYCSSPDKIFKRFQFHRALIGIVLFPEWLIADMINMFCEHKADTKEFVWCPFWLIYKVYSSKKDKIVAALILAFFITFFLFNLFRLHVWGWGV